MGVGYLNEGNLTQIPNKNNQSHTKKHPDELAKKASPCCSLKGLQGGGVDGLPGVGELCRLKKQWKEEAAMEAMRIFRANLTRFVEDLGVYQQYCGITRKEEEGEEEEEEGRDEGEILKLALFGKYPLTRERINNGEEEVDPMKNIHTARQNNNNNNNNNTKKRPLEEEKEDKGGVPIEKKSNWLGWKRIKESHKGEDNKKEEKELHIGSCAYNEEEAAVPERETGGDKEERGRECAEEEEEEEEEEDGKREFVKKKRPVGDWDSEREMPSVPLSCSSELVDTIRRSIAVQCSPHDRVLVALEVLQGSASTALGNYLNSFESLASSSSCCYSSSSSFSPLRCRLSRGMDDNTGLGALNRYTAPDPFLAADILFDFFENFPDPLCAVAQRYSNTGDDAFGQRKTHYKSYGNSDFATLMNDAKKALCLVLLRVVDVDQIKSRSREWTLRHLTGSSDGNSTCASAECAMAMGGSGLMTTMRGHCAMKEKEREKEMSGGVGELVQVGTCSTLDDEIVRRMDCEMMMKQYRYSLEEMIVICAKRKESGDEEEEEDEDGCEANGEFGDEDMEMETKQEDKRVEYHFASRLAHFLSSHSFGRMLLAQKFSALGELAQDPSRIEQILAPQIVLLNNCGKMETDSRNLPKLEHYDNRKSTLLDFFHSDYDDVKDCGLELRPKTPDDFLPLFSSQELARVMHGEYTESMLTSNYAQGLEAVEMDCEPGVHCFWGKPPSMSMARDVNVGNGHSNGKCDSVDATWASLDGLSPPTVVLENATTTLATRLQATKGHTNDKTPILSSRAQPKEKCSGINMDQKHGSDFDSKSTRKFPTTNLTKAASPLVCSIENSKLPVDSRLEPVYWLDLTAFLSWNNSAASLSRCYEKADQLMYGANGRWPLLCPGVQGVSLHRPLLGDMSVPAEDQNCEQQMCLIDGRSVVIDFPEGLGLLPNLQYIDFKGVQLVPSSLRHVAACSHSLTVLRLCDVGLHHISQVPLGSVKETLQTLDLSDNRLRSVSGVGVLSKLKYFKATRNMIDGPLMLKTLPPHLCKLDLGNNRVTSVQFDYDRPCPSVPYRTSLQDLVLTSNRLRSVSFLPSSLLRLYLGDNMLTELDLLTFSVSLRVLDVSINNLTSIPVPVDPYHLIHLNISHNTGLTNTTENTKHFCDTLQDIILLKPAHLQVLLLRNIGKGLTAKALEDAMSRRVRALERLKVLDVSLNRNLTSFPETVMSHLVDLRSFCWYNDNMSNTSGMGQCLTNADNSCPFPPSLWNRPHLMQLRLNVDPDQLHDISICGLPSLADVRIILPLVPQNDTLPSLSVMEQCVRVYGEWARCHGEPRGVSVCVRSRLIEQLRRQLSKMKEKNTEDKHNAAELEPSPLLKSFFERLKLFSFCWIDNNA
eukprot:Nk52_evm5s571 gene=Nk52_evmTU5s571